MSLETLPISSLQILEKQPIILDPVGDCQTCGDICYCQKYAAEDYLYWQGKQTPCGDNLFECDDDLLGDELVTNGDFTGNANGWTLAAGFAYNSNSIKFTFGSTPGVAAQTVAIVAGNTYRVSFTISGLGAATLLNGVNVYLGDGGTISAQAFGDGTFQFNIIAGNADSLLGFVASAGADQCILDDISLKQIGCWETEDNGWNFTNDKICHAITFTGAAINRKVTVIPNRIYKITVKITSATAGTLQVYAGGSTETLSGNGTFQVWLTADTIDNVFKLIPDTDFDGCVELISLYELSSDFKAYLINDNDEIIQDLTQYIIYYKDWITIAKRLDELSGISFGQCFRLAIADPCGTLTTTGSELLINGSFTGNASTWDLGAGASYNSNAVNFAGDSILAQTKALAASCYILTFTISNYTSGVITPKVGGVTGQAVAANGTYSQLFRTGGTGNISFTGTATLTIDDVSLKAAESCYNHTSNCLCYKESWDCNYLIEGYHNNEAFGFEFVNTGFKLSQRLIYSLFNSSSDDETDDYIYSDGIHEDHFAQIEEVQQLFIEKVPEYVHRAIMTTRRCKHFFISDDGTDMLKEYYVHKGGYTPEYVKNSLIREAPARFNVSKKGGVGFATNCS